MSSNAAAAISAMITTQVYPQLYYPPPARTVTRQRREEQEQESEVPRIFAKGTSQAIGVSDTKGRGPNGATRELLIVRKSFQIFLALGILLTILIASLANEMTLLNIVTTLISSIVYITNGVMSCSRWMCRARVKRRRVVVRVAVIMNSLGVLMALTSIIIYSLSFQLWRGEDCGFSIYHCEFVRNPKQALIVLLVLSILELGLAVMTTVFGCNHFKDINDQELVDFSREGWRDGERGDGNGKLRATSSSTHGSEQL